MLLIGNGRLVTRDNDIYYENGSVAVDGCLIDDVGPTNALKSRYPDAEFLDARGGVIHPGLINAHNHIYSAFARGLSIAGYSPKNFNDILEGMWWKIDRKLTHENNALSAEATYIDCIKNGVTTVFDHHASYTAIEGSLDDIASAAKKTGVRASLCYEVSDRDGEERMREAVLENERFILAAQSGKTDMLKGMMGLHAAFTLSDQTLAFVNEHRRGAGCHVHVAEGPGDVTDSLRKYGKRIVNRLYDMDILGEKTLAIHCVHVSPAEIRLLASTGTAVVHNPESNMGNAVGCGPVLRMCAEGVLVGLGTDGYTNDMLESYKVGNILHKHHLCDPTVAWGEIPEMLFINNAKIAARYFERPLGVLKKGAYADVAVFDYDPLTPMDGNNVNGHMLFGMNGRSAVTTVCNGRVLMRDRKLLAADETLVMRECRRSAQSLWNAVNG